MALVIAVCTSKKKGTRKQPVAEGAFREGFGLVGDAHADSQTHRQVSLLALESIEKMRAQGFDLKPGDFAENITSAGIDWLALPVGTLIRVGDVVLEMTQIGKECHTACAIRRQVGKCIMPEEGIFGRVLAGGVVRAGDAISVERPDGR
ncbi:MAG: MOSC domain-containing protein [Chloroflexi bacterium]|nr:MOSC domain-containing protein [Chloroflexota bacterium]